MISPCSICSELNQNEDSFENKEYRSLVKSGKTRIWASKDFTVIPSIGAMKDTHILIVPKSHILSFAELEHEQSKNLDKLKQNLRAYIQLKKNKDLIFFEHGTGKQGDKSGGCIEHAHLHAIEYNEQFDIKIKKHLIFIGNQPLLLKKIANRDDGYLYYQDNKNQEWITNNPKVPSQFFRKIYQESDDSIETWNWRTNFNIQLIKEVLELYFDFSNN